MAENIAQALLGLQAGQVFSYDDQIPHQSVAELEANPDIEVTSEAGTSFRHFVCNCHRFPTNLTGYRVALAYALDKPATIANSRGGHALVMDNPIPLVFNFWSYENQMQSHFYAEDIATANMTLDAAHIIDTPDSPHPGWRYYDVDKSGNWTAGDLRGDIMAPAGLKVEILSFPRGEPIHGPLVLVGNAEKCGLQMEVREAYTSYIRDSLVSGEYNIANAKTPVNCHGVPNHLFDYFHSEAYGNAIYFRYNNSEYDYNCTQFILATTRLEAREWAWNCCRILMEELPMIVCYNDKFTRAYRTDIWEGYVNQVGKNRIGGNPYQYEKSEDYVYRWNKTRFTGNPYTFQQIRLKQGAGGPYGCYPTEYITVLTEGMDSTNTLLTISGYSQTIFNLIYSRLWRVDPLDPNTNLAPDLAWNWTLEPTTASGDIQEGMKYTFHLYENITWHDGTPFTAEDVQYSLNTIHSSGWFTAEDVASIYRVDTPNDYMVEIYSNHTGYATFIQATSAQILPKHIWSLYEADDFIWNPETPYDFTGTGAYKWVHRVVGNWIYLERYADWQFGIDHPPRSPCPIILPIHPLWMEFFIAIGLIVIVSQVFVLWYVVNRRRKRQSKNGEPNQVQPLEGR
jgi:ABC-type transport system substrate-binding protein